MGTHTHVFYTRYITLILGLEYNAVPLVTIMYTTLLKIPRRKNGDSLATMGAKVSPFILGSPFFGSHRNYIRAFTVIFTGFDCYF